MISIEPKLDALHEGLQEIEQYTKYLDLDILRKLGSGVVKKSKSGYSGLLRKRTGRMYKGIYSYTDRGKKQQVVTNNATNPPTSGGVRYPWVLAHGATIQPRNGKMLTFITPDGKWRRAHSVIIPSFDWLERPGNQYMSSLQADDDIEYVVQKKIDQLKKKGVLA